METEASEDGQVVSTSDCSAGGLPKESGILPHSSFETQRICHLKFKTGVSVAPQKDMCPPKVFNEAANIFATCLSNQIMS